MKNSLKTRWLGWLNRILVVLTGARFKITGLITEGLKMITMITKRAARGRKINYLVPVTIFLLFLFMWCLAPGNIYAQDQKIVATTNQQYHNLVRNASFESWSGGSSAIPDAWLNENTPSYLKLTSDKMMGSASLKVTVSSCMILRSR